MNGFTPRLNQYLLLKVTAIFIIATLAISTFLAIRLTAQGITASAYTFESPSGNIVLVIDENCARRCAHSVIVTTKPTPNSTRTHTCAFNPLTMAKIFDQAEVSWSADEQQIFWRSTQSELRGSIDIGKECISVGGTFIKQ